MIQMKNLSDDLKEIQVIERVLWKCFGKHGQCALVKTRSSSSSSFMLTHDGCQLLNIISPSAQNRLYTILINTINRHSKVYGDNVKLLFLYMTESIRRLISADSCVRVALRLTSISSLIDLVRANLITISHPPDSFDDLIPKLGVLTDLDKFNPGLATFSSQLIPDLIKAYPNSSNLRSIIDDFEFTLIYSDKSSMANSRLLTNGFVLDGKLNVSTDCFKRPMNALFMIKSNSDPTNVRIDSMDTLVECQRGSFFSKEFLESLIHFDVGLVFYEGGLNEFKKQELKNRQRGFVAYLSIELVQFLCQKLHVQPIYEDEIWNKKNIDLASSIFRIESIESIDNFYFYRVNRVDHLTFVYFCSPIRAVFSQFKSHLCKVLRTLASLFDDEGDQKLKFQLVYSNQFECQLAFIFQKLEYEYVRSNRNLGLTCHFLRDLFESFQIAEQTKSESNSFVFYEPLNLKLAVLEECLENLKMFSSLDLVYFNNVKKS